MHMSRSTLDRLLIKCWLSVNRDVYFIECQLRCLFYWVSIVMSTLLSVNRDVYFIECQSRCLFYWVSIEMSILLSVNQDIYFIECQSRCWSSVNWVSIGVWLSARCCSQVNQGYWLTLDCRCLQCTRSASPSSLFTLLPIPTLYRGRI